MKKTGGIYLKIIAILFCTNKLQKIAPYYLQFFYFLNIIFQNIILILMIAFQPLYHIRTG